MAEENKKMSILLVDDDKGILFTLQKLVAKIFPELEILTAANGQSAYVLTANNHPSIIVSDYSMPIMNGMEFLEKVRENKDFNDIFFIMLTANNEVENRRNAINKGADEFISKPIITESFETRLRSALRIISMQYQMKQENIKLKNLASDLRDTIQDMAKLSVKFMHARMPASFQVLQRVAKAATWIAKEFKEFSNEEIFDISIAAYLSQTGRMTLPDNMIDLPVLRDGNPTNDLMCTLPAATRDILQTVKRFENIGHILFCMYENPDGTGFPNHLRSWEIPVASRIIRVCLDFEELILYGNHSPEDALKIINLKAQQHYDMRACILLDSYLKTNNVNFAKNFHPIKLGELKPNMILGKEIITDKGLKLVNAGVVLSQSMIDKIIAHTASDPIVGSIYIKK